MAMENLVVAFGFLQVRSRSGLRRTDRDLYHLAPYDGPAEKRRQSADDRAPIG
jgi:hypothetical protein